MSAYQIKQSSTAYPLVFLMVDSSDHVSAKTGATVTVTLSKAGGAFSTAAGSPSAATEISAGWYKVPGNATDTGTLGSLALHATATGCDPTDLLYEVVAFDPQDAIRQGLTALPSTAPGVTAGFILLGTSAGQINADGSGNVSTTHTFKKGVARAGVEFLMTDSVNHAPATSKTVTVTRSIDGAAFGAGGLSNPATEISAGMYYVNMASGDLNGNVITLRMTASGCDDQFVTIFTQP